MEEDIITHRRAHFVFILLFALCIFFLSAHLSRYVLGVKNFMFYVVNPTPQAAAKAVQSLQVFSHNMSEIVRIHQDNQALRSIVKQYTYLADEAAKEHAENERLRSLVGFTPPPRLRSITARVIIREPSSWFQWIMIDRGKDDGIRVDSPVLSWTDGKPVALGRVVETFGHSSKVVLLTNVLSALPVQVEPTGADGLLEGQNDKNLKVNYLVTDSTSVTAGCAVMTSPLSSVFPEGVLAGYVQEMSPPTEETFRSATIRPAAHMESLREVMVLVRKEE